MTKEQFLEEVKALGLKWKVNPSMAYESEIIRCEKGDCPIVALGRSKGILDEYYLYNANYKKIGVLLDLSLVDSIEIAKVADANPFHNVEFRKQMMEVLDVK